MADERDQQGRFAPGNAVRQGDTNPNAGRKPSEFKSMVNRVLSELVTDDALSEIVRVAIAQAQQGQTDARNFLFDRIVGKPISELDLAIINAIAPARGGATESETPDADDVKRGRPDADACREPNDEIPDIARPLC